MNQPGVAIRRRFPRVGVCLPIEVKAESGLVFITTTQNISQTGLLFVADRRAFEQLTACQRSAEKSQPAEVDIKILLPMGANSTSEIGMHCRLLQLRRVSRDCYHIGLEYVNLSESEYDALSCYIQSMTDCNSRWQLSRAC